MTKALPYAVYRRNAHSKRIVLVARCRTRGLAKVVVNFTQEKFPRNSVYITGKSPTVIF